MKIAICFYGQPRRYVEVLPQWNRIISDLNADTFIHTWYGEDRGRINIDINELIKNFSPKEIEVSTPHKFTSIIPKNYRYENQSYHAMNQAYSLTKCIHLMNSYSNFFEKKYDVVIKTRFDITLENVQSFIEFVKNEVEINKMYVAANHWSGSDMFDDNIMVGNYDLITNTSKNYFEYTIQYIRKTGIIPGGEHNIFRHLEKLNLTENIIKVNSLNFSLLPLPFNEIILNQNEE